MQLCGSGHGVERQYKNHRHDHSSFPYIVDNVKGLKNKTFAVIIDEAHSSTAGKDMAAVTQSLGAGEQEFTDAEDMITDEIRRNGKQANVSIFAFTATPNQPRLCCWAAEPEGPARGVPCVFHESRPLRKALFWMCCRTIRHTTLSTRSIRKSKKIPDVRPQRRNGRSPVCGTARD